MPEIKLNAILHALLGKQELIERWWNAPNHSFEGRTPLEVYKTDRVRVLDYLIGRPNEKSA